MAESTLLLAFNENDSVPDDLISTTPRSRSNQLVNWRYFCKE